MNSAQLLSVLLMSFALTPAAQAGGGGTPGPCPIVSETTLQVVNEPQPILTIHAEAKIISRDCRKDAVAPFENERLQIKLVALNANGVAFPLGREFLDFNIAYAESDGSVVLHGSGSTSIAINEAGEATVTSPIADLPKAAREGRLITLKSTAMRGFAVGRSLISID
jgi:hypothetical protein